MVAYTKNNLAATLRDCDWLADDAAPPQQQQHEE